MIASIDTHSLTSDLLQTPGPRARALVERDNEVFAPCAGRVYPFVIERGEGCYVWDVDGNRYLDLNAGIAVVAAGHSHPRMVRAIQEQATRFIHMAGTDFYNEPMIKLGENSHFALESFNSIRRVIDQHFFSKKFPVGSTNTPYFSIASAS